MKIKKYKHKKRILLIVIFGIILLLVNLVQAGTSDPGSDLNPLVSQDYVDAKIVDLNMRINSLSEYNTNLSKQIQDLQRQIIFEKLSIPAGKQVLLGTSAEMVLRTGTATAIESPEGGLSNLISGKNLLLGQEIPRDQLILVPVGDGRGFKTVTDVWVLIKGTYSIK